MPLQGFSGRSLQGFTRSLQGFSGGLSNIYLSSQNDDKLLHYNKHGNAVAASAVPNNPMGLTYYKNQIYQCSLNGEIYIYDKDLSLVGNFSTGVVPHDVTLYQDEIYVSSSGYISVFDLSGTLQRDVALTGFDVQGISVMDDEVYVVCWNSPPLAYTIRVYSASLVFQRSWGTMGTNDDEFTTSPLMFGVEAYAGEVYTAQGPTVRVFSPTGVYARRWVTGGISAGGGIAIKNGVCALNINDTNNLSVYLTSTTGTPIANFQTSSLIGVGVNYKGIAVS